MTEPVNGTPRHLNPVTAQFPAITRSPRHAAPDGVTSHIPRISADQVLSCPPTSPTPPVRRSWWRRAWSWLVEQ